MRGKTVEIKGICAPGFEAVHEAFAKNFAEGLERPIGTYLYGRRMYETMVFWETVTTEADEPAVFLDYAGIWAHLIGGRWPDGQPDETHEKPKGQRAVPDGTPHNQRPTSPDPPDSVRLIEDHIVTVRLLNRLLTPGSERQRTDDLFSFCERVPSPTFGQVLGAGPCEDLEAFVDLAFELALPLEHQTRWADDQGSRK